MTLPTIDQVVDSLGRVREEVAAIGRDGISIVAVTKGFPPEIIDVARGAGITDIGESYAQELLGKLDHIDEERLHFIGRIQRNKVRKIADAVDLWHSVDRPELLSEVGKRTPGAKVLIQVNSSADPTKAGVEPAELPSMLSQAERDGVVPIGLMTIGVQHDPEATRRAFLDIDALATEFGLTERSMGMSGDYLDAASAGATMLRLGSVLFGPRPE